VGQIVTGPMDEQLVLAPFDERVTAIDWQDQLDTAWPPQE
jgi:hypothetical protein